VSPDVSGLRLAGQNKKEKRRSSKLFFTLLLKKDRVLGFKSLKQTFLGCQAVDWMSANSEKSRRQESIVLLSEMLRYG
jgi:hypothetical protein